MTQYFRNIVMVEILSNKPWKDEDLLDLEVVEYETGQGGSSGLVTIMTRNQQVNRTRMAQLLTAQGSDPEFLDAGEEP